TKSPISISLGLASLRPRARRTRPTRSSHFRCAAPSTWRHIGARWPGEPAARAASPYARRYVPERAPRMLPPLRERARLAGLETRQQTERILALDGALVGHCEAPVRNASIDLRAVAERKVGAVEHLRDRHHFQQRGDLPWCVALRQLVVELPEVGQRAIGEIRWFALRGQADETAGQEWQRTAAVGEDPANIRKLHCRSAEHDVRDGTRGIGGVFDRPRRDARNEAAAASRRGRVDVNDGLATVDLFINRGKRRIAEIFVLVAGQQTDAVRLERVQRVF